MEQLGSGLHDQQSVRIHNVSSSSIVLSTGSPQGCVLRPLLFTLLTYDCSLNHPGCHIVKFADDSCDGMHHKQRRDQLQEGGGTLGGLVREKQSLLKWEEDEGNDCGLQEGKTHTHTHTSEVLQLK